MAMEQVQGILEGLKIAQSRRAENLRAAQEAARLQQQEEYQKSEAANRDAQLAELVNQHRIENQRLDLTTKVALAAHKLTQLSDQQKLAEGSQQSGMPIPGSIISNLPPAIGGFPGVGSLIPRTQTIPGTGSDGQPDVAVPFYPTSQWDAMQANRQRVLNAPAEETKTREAQALQEAEGKRIEAQRAADQANAVKLEGMRTASAATVANIAANSRIAAAGIKNNAELADFDPTPYATGAANGTYGAADIKKLPKAQANLVNNTLSQAGVVPLDDSQKKFLEGLGPAVELIPKMDMYNNALAQRPIESRVPFSEAKNNLDNLEQQIKSGVISASTGAFGQSARAMALALKADTGAYTPSSNFTYQSTNLQKRNAYVHAVNEAIDQKLGNIPVGQKHLIKQQYGLDKFLDNAGSPPPTGQNSQAAPAHLYFDAQGNPVQQGGKP